MKVPEIASYDQKNRFEVQGKLLAIIFPVGKEKSEERHSYINLIVQSSWNIKM